MNHNFLHIEPGSERANRWRNAVGLFSVFLGVCGGWIAFGHPGFLSFFSDEAREAIERTLPDFVSLEADTIQAGGDVVIAPPTPPALPVLIAEAVAPEPASFSAASILVKDRTSGMVLYGKDPYIERPIASITKLMSALVLLERGVQWDQTAVVVGEDALDSHMYAGDTFTLTELWNAALIGSSNKAILTLARAAGWTEDAAFVERMNQKAVEIGLSNTHFADPSGLLSENTSTASDAAILLEEALAHPAIVNAMLQNEYHLYSKERQKPHHMWNTNWLLLGWIPHQFAQVLGGKTGYIPASGYNFSVSFADALGHTIDVVVLGAQSHEARFTEARDIAAWAFQHYQWPQESNDLSSRESNNPIIQ